MIYTIRALFGRFSLNTRPSRYNRIMCVYDFTSITVNHKHAKFRIQVPGGTELINALKRLIHNSDARNFKMFISTRIVRQ